MGLVLSTSFMPRDTTKAGGTGDSDARRLSVKPVPLLFEHAAASLLGIRLISGIDVAHQ